MRAFIISCSTLLLILSLIIVNFFYIINIYKHMTNETSEITLSSIDKVTTLLDYWNKRRIFISLSVPHRISDELEKNLQLLKIKVMNGTKSDFEEIKQLLLNSIEELRIHAGISADALF